ncbi:unnamed protein product [Prunus armeniaca]|uniref:Uncharacterized protein n=1 Tax=Prunus armeniaca TaxID=36596 RepID=A0A6J5Y086_PRUAR|nr:unnamed protein product [Prunus armeniaca]CAB4318781.1 unnamed protein product [Prunus armeniaca]
MSPGLRLLDGHESTTVPQSSGARTPALIPLSACYMECSNSKLPEPLLSDFQGKRVHEIPLAKKEPIMQIYTYFLMTSIK